jgi:type II secretory pathway pseudopilin PulG
MKARQAYQRQGFTILELLVASAVSIILLGLFLTVSTNILDAWSSSRDSLSSNAKARIVLDTLATDLESAILRSDQGVWLACDLLESTATSGRWESSSPQKPTGGQSLQIDFKDLTLSAEDYRFGVSGSWICFFASPADAAQSGNSGDINAVAYQLIRRKPHSRSSDADESYNLYRSVVPADHTLDEVVEDGGYYIDAFDGASYEGQAGEIIAPRNDSSLLARDVVDFGIAFYTLDGSGRNRASYPSSSGQKYFRVPRDGLPTSAEIFVRILEEEGAKRLNAFERGLIPTEDPDFWWNTVIEFSSVYTRRIQFKGGDL